MTIGGWILFGVMAFVIVIGAIGITIEVCTTSNGIFMVIIVAILILLALFFGIRWYYQNTESGQRALVDQQSELDGGLDRTITIYTADGNVIAEYSGKIDIEGNDGGYVLFDFEGKRYTYYNCFVESIADIN